MAGFDIKAIASQLSLTEEQRKQIMGLKDNAEVRRFLKEHGIDIPEGLDLGNVAAAIGDSGLADGIGSLLGGGRR